MAGVTTRGGEKHVRERLEGGGELLLLAVETADRLGSLRKRISEADEATQYESGERDRRTGWMVQSSIG